MRPQSSYWRRALTTKGVLLSASVLALVVAGLAPADAQSLAAERAQERRDAVQARLQQMDRAAFQERVESARARYEAGDTALGARAEMLATLDAADVQARLDAREEDILSALAQADPDAIAARLNAAGAEAAQRLENAPGELLTPAQLDQLVAAADYAETINVEQVGELLDAGALRVEGFFETRDAQQITQNLNEIGGKALNALPPE